MPSRVVDVLRDIARALSGLRLRWYLFGAQAAIFHGVTRATADLDVTVDVGEKTTAQLVDALTRRGFVLRVDGDDEEFITQTRVIPLVHRDSSLPVDVVLSGPGLEELFFEHVESFTVEGAQFPVASAEDMIVMKILAGRARDLDDAEAIVAARGPSLDYSYIEALLQTLERALDQKDLLPQLERIRRQVG